MSSKYRTDYERVHFNPPIVLFDVEDCERIQDAFKDKGYQVFCINRFSNDGDLKNSIRVNRDELQVVCEVLFKKRLDLEIHPSKSFKVEILLLNNIDVDSLIAAVKRFLPSKVIVSFPSLCMFGCFR